MSSPYGSAGTNHLKDLEPDCDSTPAALSLPGDHCPPLLWNSIASIFPHTLTHTRVTP